MEAEFYNALGNTATSDLLGYQNPGVLIKK